MSTYSGLQYIRDLAQAEWHRLQAENNAAFHAARVMDRGDTPYGSTREHRDAIRANLDTKTVTLLHLLDDVGAAIKAIDELIEKEGERPCSSSERRDGGGDGGSAPASGAAPGTTQRTPTTPTVVPAPAAVAASEPREGGVPTPASRAGREVTAAFPEECLKLLTAHGLGVVQLMEMIDAAKPVMALVQTMIKHNGVMVIRDGMLQVLVPSAALALGQEGGTK